MHTAPSEWRVLAGVVASRLRSDFGLDGRVHDTTCVSFDSDLEMVR